jgi:O-antigen ligase
MGKRDEKDRFGYLCSKIAKLSFFIYLFFIIFGTSMPFQDEVRGIEDQTASNLINQFLFSSLFMLSLICLIPKKQLIFRIIQREKFLTLFLLWSFFSVFWSDFPFTSFKRWIQIAGSAIVCTSVLVYFPSADKAFNYLKIILGCFITLSFLSILIIPGAIQWDFPAWRGLAVHKNTLGQVSLVSLMVWTFCAIKSNFYGKLIAYLFWLLSFVLLIGSKSTTSFLAGAVLLAIAGIIYAKRVFVRPVLGQFLASIFVFSFFLGLSSIIYLEPSILATAFGLFGKDVTLTGRLDLWVSIFDETKRHLLYGCGIGGFWGVNSQALASLYEEYVWLPTHAHSGYLDIMNETGIVGILLITLMVTFYFYDLTKVEKPHFWKWFVMAALILNITESTLFRLNELIGLLFTFSYLACYSQILKCPNSLHNKVKNVGLHYAQA